MRTWLIPLVLAGSFAGCAPLSAACTTVTTITYCTDVVGVTPEQRAQFEANCSTAANPGTPHDGLCARLGVVGGCQSTISGVVTTVWFYAPLTPAQVQPQCAAQGLAFVTP